MVEGLRRCVRSNGRYALAPDRVSSSAITSPELPMKYDAEKGVLSGGFIMGLTDNKATRRLVPVAKSWLTPAELRLTVQGYDFTGYDRYQRAYVLNCRDKGSPSKLEFELAASEESPVVNLALVIENWGRAPASLKIDGRKIKRGRDFRFGYRETLAGSDLIVWINAKGTKKLKVTISPVEK